MKRPPLRLDPLAIRGTNYLPSVSLATDSALGWQPQTPSGYEPTRSGFFNAAHNDQELAQMARFGLNNIRLFGSFWSWVMHPGQYLATLRAIAANCARHRITITYVTWNSTGSLGFDPGVALTKFFFDLTPGNPHPTVRDRLIQLVVGSALSAPRSLATPPGEPWHGGVIAEPGNVLFGVPLPSWPPPLLACSDRYLRDIAGFFATDEVGQYVFQSYDLFNEPEAAYSDDFGGRQRVFDFIVRTRDVVRDVHPDAQLTVGWAGVVPDEVTELHARVPVEYLSSHLYRTDADLARDVTWIRDLAVSAGLPYVVSEFWERRLDPLRPFRTRLGPQVDILAEAGVGGQMWGFLESNIFDQPDLTAPGIEVDGMVQPRRGQWVPKLSGKGFPLPTPWPKGPLQFVDNLPDPGDALALGRWTRSGLA